jgi:hypothetical protein
MQEKPGHAGLFFVRATQHNACVPIAEGVFECPPA